MMQSGGKPGSAMRGAFIAPWQREMAPRARGEAFVASAKPGRARVKPKADNTLHAPYMTGGAFRMEPEFVVKRMGSPMTKGVSRPLGLEAWELPTPVARAVIAPASRQPFVGVVELVRSPRSTRLMAGTGHTMRGRPKSR